MINGSLRRRELNQFRDIIPAENSRGRGRLIAAFDGAGKTGTRTGCQVSRPYKFCDRDTQTPAWYSNTAGNNTTVQNQFLVVSVDGGTTGLYGTSFAAPIVSGYAAIVSSKFTTASATQVASQLLTTARQDTILRYDAALHGQGEACISCALAPVSVN